MPAISANDVSAAGTTTCATYAVTSAVATTASQRRPMARLGGSDRAVLAAAVRTICIESAAPAGGAVIAVVRQSRGSIAWPAMRTSSSGCPASLMTSKKRGGSSGAADQIDVSQ